MVNTTNPMPSIREVEELWASVSSFIFVPTTDAENERLVAFIDRLIDAGGGNEENHPLASLMDVIGTLVEAYEAENVPIFEKHD